MDEYIIEEENIQEIQYYNPIHIKEKPVTFIDKLDEITGGRGRMTLIMIIVIVIGTIMFMVFNKEKIISKFVKPAGYMFTMPNPGYPPTGYMYPPAGYHPNYPAIYP